MTSRGKTVTAVPVIEASPETATVSAPTPAPVETPAQPDAGVSLSPEPHVEQVTGGEVIDLRPEGDPLAALTRPKRGRGRPLGSKTRRAINPEPERRPIEGVVQAKVDYRATAEFAVRTVTGLASSVIGPEWTPTQPEDKSLCDATEIYFRAKGIPDIPPGWMLFICVMAYATPRLNHPETKNKLARVITRIKNIGRPKNAYPDLRGH